MLKTFRIVLVQLKGDQVCVGIECPPTMRVLREELYQAVRNENLALMSADPKQMGDLDGWMLILTPREGEGIRWSENIQIVIDQQHQKGFPKDSPPVPIQVESADFPHESRKRVSF